MRIEVMGINLSLLLIYKKLLHGCLKISRIDYLDVKGLVRNSLQ